MSFPRYPEYKDSGVEWLGEVPAHWELRKLKHIASFTGGGTPSRENPAYWNGEIPWVSPKDMKSERILGTEEAITDDGLANSTAALIPPQCVLMVVRSGILKHTIPVAINDIPVSLNQDMKALSFPARSCRPGFFLRWVQGLNDRLLLAWAKQGATVESIEHEYLGNTLIALPPITEQISIAAFLDRETGKIDALVAEQQRLIELLKEKRQAVISHAVTKGLNPDAPMKPSGVEWLGEVPAHWDVGPVKRFFSSQNSRRVPLSTEERSGRQGEFPYYGASGVIDYVDEYIFEEDLVLVSEDGANLLSRSMPIAFVATGQYWVNNHAHILKSLDHNHIFWAERLEAVDLTPFVTGSAQPKLTSEALHSLLISVPSTEDERRAIQDHIVAASAKNDALTVQAQRAIDLLQERRAALISAAVTGQIDVRAIADRAAA